MWYQLILVAVLIVTVQATRIPLLDRSSIPITAKQEPATGYRLPNTTVPLKYNIELTTHIHDHGSEAQFDFEGKVTIFMRVRQSNVRSITLHYRELTVTHVRLSDSTGRVLVDDDSSFSTDETHEFLVIHAPELVEGGIYSLEIEYDGELREDNGGFYRSSYTDATGNTRWIATTQFEATNARHGFPCYDEPGTRAPIGLKITHGSTYHAISNMPVKSQVDSVIPNYKTTEFEDTLSMQTYLLAFVISDFDSISNSANNQSVFAVPKAIANGDLHYALQAGVKVLNVLEDYLQVRYSFPKLDQIAIPDFAAGAMENWGLVTYREEILLYSSTSSPMSQMKRTASVIAHEYGHQFFGNLVSPAWWSYLWLNEGFATLMEYWASHQAYPELRILEMFNVEALQTVFQSDALESTRAMNFYVETPAAISRLFDEIAYQKAGSVLRMLQHAFGDSTFRSGLKYYLEAKQFQSATPDDLAAGLQRAVDESNVLPQNVKVADIVSSWADQEGYPVVHVSRSSDNVIKLRQERYLLKASDTAAKTTWYIPYNLATYQADDFSSTRPLNWLIEETTEIRPTSTLNWDSDHWVILNKQQTGYYRVNYDDNLWDLLIQELRHGYFSNIHHLNRAQLIDDSLNLARSSHLQYDVALQLIQYLINEREYIPWDAADNGLAFLNRMLAGSSKYDLFKNFVWNFVEPAFSHFGTTSKPSESHFDKRTRNIVINWACTVDAKECLDQTHAQLAEVVSHKIPDIDPNLKRVIYCNGLRNAGRIEFWFVWDRLRSSQDPAERRLIMSALGCSQDTLMLMFFLDTSLDETGAANYRDQERSLVLSAVYSAGGKTGLKVAMSFLAQNAAKIDRLYNGGSFGGKAISAAVIGMAGQIVNEEQQDLFIALIEMLAADNYLTNAEVTAAKELTSENILWTTKNYAVIENWLEKNMHSSASTTRSFVSLVAIVVISVIIH